MGCWLSCKLSVLLLAYTREMIGNNSINWHLVASVLHARHIICWLCSWRYILQTKWYATQYSSLNRCYTCWKCQPKATNLLEVVLLSLCDLIIKITSNNIFNIACHTNQPTSHHTKPVTYTNLKLTWHLLPLVHSFIPYIEKQSLGSVTIYHPNNPLIKSIKQRSSLRLCLYFLPLWSARYKEISWWFRDRPHTIW